MLYEKQISTSRNATLSTRNKTSNKKDRNNVESHLVLNGDNSVRGSRVKK